MLWCGALVVSLSVASIGPELLVDADTTPQAHDSSPHDFVAVGGDLWFLADDAAGVARLYQSVAATAAPRAVDLPAGLKPLVLWGASDRLLVRIGESIDAMDPVTHALVKLAGGAYYWALSVGGLVYFEDSAGTSLLVTDGHPESTRVLPLPPSATLVGWGDRVVLAVAATNELRMLDRSGSHRLAQVGPAGGPGPAYVVPIGDMLVFAGDDGVHGRELMRADADGRVSLIDDVTPGPASTAWYEAGGVAGRAIFLLNGPDGGLVLATDGETVEQLAPSGNVFILGTHGAQMVLGVQSPDGVQLYATDGTSRGTRALGAPIGHFVRGLGDTQNGLLIASDNGLYVVDGERLDLVVEHVVPGSNGPAVPVGGALAFGASDTTHGEEPWISDGTPAGTRMLANLAPDGTASSFPSVTWVLGGRALFLANTSDVTMALWSTDGTPEGTRPLLSGASGLFGGGVAVLQGELILAWSGRIYRTDGTPEHTGPIDSTLAGCTVLGASTRVFLRCGGGLWSLDRPDAVPVKLGPLGNLAALAGGGGRLWFALIDATGSRVDLWDSDGTAAGTAWVTTLTSRGASASIQILPDDAGALVALDDGSTSELIWVVATGPVAVTSAKSVPHASQLTRVGQHFYFQLGNGLARSPVTDPLSMEDISAPAAAMALVATRSRLFAQSSDQSLWEMDDQAGELALHRLAPRSAILGQLRDDLLISSAAPDGSHEVIWRASDVGTPLVALADLPPNTFGVSGRGAMLGHTLLFPAVSNGDVEMWRYVLPNEGPKISCPEAIHAPAGVPVAFAATASDDVDENLSVEYSQPPGSVFPPGTVTTVTARVVDSDGAEASCAFEVKVDAAPRSGCSASGGELFAALVLLWAVASRPRSRRTVA